MTFCSSNSGDSQSGQRINFQQWLDEQQKLLGCRWDLIDPERLLGDPRSLPVKMKYPLEKQKDMLSYVVIRLSMKVQNAQMWPDRRVMLENDILKLSRGWMRGILTSDKLNERIDVLARELNDEQRIAA